ncbi:replication-relaxation family protein [Rummeliibacillus stabekisii]|uniref:replication-relaxation family protein n=1 Tax=Rummeliibacillus stabekisii TaxID=241244 RepID=UPI000A046DCC|nr:replication-relaxation family protein [Rummeliibacillus stabekisii]
MPKLRQLSQREESILSLLKKFDFLTRDQIRFYFGLGKKRNTNRVLNGLSDYLNSIRDFSQSVYYLNKIGREYVGCEKVRKKSSNVQHYIMRNEFYFYNSCPSDWKNEIKVSDGHSTVIVDAMYSKLETTHFLEVDNLQPMSENRIKAKRYLELFQNGLLAEELGHFPTLVWLTTSELRRMQLKELCKDLPVCQVYLYDEIKE